MRSFIFKYFASMFLDQRAGGEPMASIGRVILGLVFVAAMYVWLWNGKDIPPTMSQFLMAALLYVVGEKVTAVAKQGISKWRPGRESVTTTKIAPPGAGLDEGE